jgi:hypothetical protein
MPLFYFRGALCGFVILATIARCMRGLSEQFYVSICITDGK